MEQQQQQEQQQEQQQQQQQQQHQQEQQCNVLLKEASLGLNATGCKNGGDRCEN